MSTGHAVAQAVSGFTVERVLRGTHYLRILSLVDFVAVLLHLPQMLQTNPLYARVKLVVIDSMAFHFRFGEAVQDFAQRSRMLFALGQHLQRAVAAAFKVAVVVTNHVTQRQVGQSPSEGAQGGRSPAELIPSLGDAWSHAVSTRLLLRHPVSHTATVLEDGVSQLRHVALLKAPSRPRAECTIRLCAKGIRNAPPAELGGGDGKRSREE